MNRYRILLLILLSAVYILIFWVLPWLGDGATGVMMMHVILVFSGCLVSAGVWLFDRC